MKNVNKKLRGKVIGRNISCSVFQGYKPLKWEHLEILVVMENRNTQPKTNSEFATRISYELKRAERYRIFVSLLVFSLDSIVEKLAVNRFKSKEDKDSFLRAVKGFVRESVREVDAVSNSNAEMVGILCPETSRQGAEAAARRLQESLNNFLSDYFGDSTDLLIPVEISSYPDAAGARSLASYSEQFA